MLFLKILSKRKLLFILAFISIVLSSCKSNDDTSILVDELDGIAINSSNYETVFTHGVVNSAKLSGALSFSLDRLLSNDPAALLTVQQSQTDSITYDCIGLSVRTSARSRGTLKVVTINENTEEWHLDGCLLGNYNNTGKLLVKTTINSGILAEINSSNRFDYNWSVTRHITLTNYRNDLYWSNEQFFYNGEVVVTWTNDLVNASVHNTIASSNLIGESDTNAGSGNEFKYLFTHLLRDEVRKAASSILDYDFVANITNIGDIQLTVAPSLEFASGSDLIEGSGLLTTGASTLKFKGVGVGSSTGAGGHDLDIYIDPENDGTFEEPIASSWYDLGGGGSITWRFLGFLMLLMSIIRFIRLSNK